MQGSFQHVIHAAAVVPVTRVASNPGEAVAVNVSGTANVAAVTHLLGKQLTYISTSHVYDPDNAALSETSDLRPSSLYGLTKLQGESWVERLAPRSQIVRVFSFFDVDQPDFYVVPKLFARIRAASLGEKLPLMGFYDTRDIASSTWHANVIVRLLESETVGPVNCGTGVGVPIAQLAREIAIAAGRPDVSFEPLNSDPVSSSAIVADTKRLREILGDVAEEPLASQFAMFSGKS